VLIGSDGPKQKNAPTLVWACAASSGAEVVADNGRPASLHSGKLRQHRAHPVLPLARLIEDSERVRAFGESHDASAARQPRCSPKWEERGGLENRSCAPTVNINHFHERRRLAHRPRARSSPHAHARLDIRVTPDTPRRRWRRS